MFVYILLVVFCFTNYISLSVSIHALQVAYMSIDWLIVWFSFGFGNMHTQLYHSHKNNTERLNAWYIAFRLCLQRLISMAVLYKQRVGCASVEQEHLVLRMYADKSVHQPAYAVHMECSLVNGRPAGQSRWHWAARRTLRVSDWHWHVAITRQII